MRVGIDDTDSRTGMCTTYLCKLIIDALSTMGTVRGLPRLIRLNPNIPYKTRGNGALSFSFDGPWEKAERVITTFLDAHYEHEKNTNPGVVLVDDGAVPILHDHYQRALHEIVTIDEARELARDADAQVITRGNGRGLIGALAAIGATVPSPTYELIAYRLPAALGTKRFVDPGSVREVERRFHPVIFDSYDWNNGYVAIAPNSPCPVLYGIRGTDPDALSDAAHALRSEPVYKHQLFLTNQATDAHIVDRRIADIVPYESVHCRCSVTTYPHFEHKGHLFFEVDDGSGSLICAAYEPTKEFRTTMSRLVPGDVIDVWGGVKDTPYGRTVNLEKVRVVELAEQRKSIVPTCCSVKMRSVGAGKGYRCKKCGRRVSQELVATAVVPRDISTGYYEVPVIARRHLARPLSLGIMI